MSEKEDYPVPPQTLAVFREQYNVIKEKVVARSLQRNEEVEHHGDKADSIIKEGIDFTLKMLDAALATEDLDILEDQLTWAFKRLPHDEVVPEHVLSRFQLLYEVENEVLSAEHAGYINRYVQWMIDRQRALLSG